MNAEAAHHALAGSLAGQLKFTEVVRMMMAAGVESYFADLIRGQEVFYAPGGETHVEQMIVPPPKVAAEFSQPAIRAAQADEVRYPEFLKRATAAGVAAYWAFLASKRVIYFGRKGEFHIEDFPPQP